MKRFIQRINGIMGRRNQLGFTLTEVLIALAILGLVGVSVMSAIIVSNRTILTSQQQTIADNLTRTTIEYLKGQPYDDSTGEYIIPKTDVDTGEDIVNTDGPPYYGQYRIGNDPDPNINKVIAEILSPDGYVQKITVEVYYLETLISSTEAYKVSR